MKKSVILSIILICGLLCSGLARGRECPKPDRQPATKALMKLVANDDALRISLKASIVLGQKVNSDPQTNPVASIEDYYDFIDALVTYDPRNIDTGLQQGGIRVSMDGDNYCKWNFLDILSYSYFLVDRQITTDPRGQIQFANQDFSDWMRQIAEYWGDYLEKKESLDYVSEFLKDPNFGNWYCPNESYASFQEFFTRKLCPDQFPNGTRPVHGYYDPRTVVSVGDSNTLGTWPISPDGKLVTSYDGVSQAGRMIKGQLYSDIPTFILGGDDETILKEFGELDPTIFNGGTFTHQFLNVNNYHRLHVPVAGKLVYMRHLQSGTRLKSGWKPSLGKSDIAHYAPLDPPDWQFGQTR
ncbi:MAG: hypothetical protein GY850_45060, partial [bacterium]|nr:hypothetical protein [bacterium]